MSQVNSATAANSALSNLSIGGKDTDKKSNEMGQSTFLKLMITQMNNQDPLSPQKNSEFVAQLAQFSSVEGLDNLNKQFKSFSGNFKSNQALQASSLVGRSVSIPTDTTELREGGIISGSAKLPESASDVQVGIYDASGSLAAKVPLGAQKAGNMVFRFDGQNMEVNGKLVNWSAGDTPMPAGKYQFKVMANTSEGTTQLDTSLSANVNSVTLDKSGSVVLNLAGAGAVNISDVTQFN